MVVAMEGSTASEGSMAVEREEATEEEVMVAVKEEVARAVVTVAPCDEPHSLNSLYSLYNLYDQ